MFRILRPALMLAALLGGPALAQPQAPAPGPTNPMTPDPGPVPPTARDRLQVPRGVVEPAIRNPDPEILVPAPVPDPGTTPVIPPPGTPGGDPTVQPR